LDNLTHSLLGAAFTELALPRPAAPITRRVFFAAGLVSANLPDVDILYAGITPEPLGYLLHHRGHTHTVAGLLPQGLLLALALLAIPAARRVMAAHRGPLALLGVAGLLSHLVLDSWNSYGLHPFPPFDADWYYGDAVFIFEPWLWLFLGVSAVANAIHAWTRVAAAAVFLLPLALAAVGALPTFALATLALAGALLAWGLRGRPPRARAAAALALSGAFVAVLFVLSHRAESRVRAALEPTRPGHIVDVVLNPNPGLPLCWGIIAVEKDATAGEYVLHRGTLSLAPGAIPSASCPSHRIGRLEAREIADGGRITWAEPIHQSLQGLRERTERDCWVRAWMQFGRAPVVKGDSILDLRFDTGRGGNFTAMPVRPVAPSGDAGTCPPHVTPWAMPRADLLAP
jgi:inner membrane protein